MSLEMGHDSYEIKPLIAAQNYQQWKMAIENILSVDGTLKVALGEESKPSDPSTLPKGGSDEAIDRSKRRLQDFED